MTDEKKNSVRRDLQRLAGKSSEDMGTIYNVLAITARQNASEGFGGKTFP
jgi:SAM-dependent MidA family methyltransferase